MKGDTFTKLLRRRLQVLRRDARESDRLDRVVDGPQGCSDSYDESQRAWARYREAQAVLELYLQVKGWK